MRAAADQNRLIRAGASRLGLAALVGVVSVLPIILVSMDAVEAQVVKTASHPVKIAITDDARAKARDIFSERCAACHGANGKGDGPAAANLKPRPIDFHNRNWQKSVTDDSITKAIVFGGRAVGKSGQMAPNPDLENEPAIVAALVEKIREWGK